jgi:hypothetical protein
MSVADVVPYRRRWALVKLGRLFSEIDDAIARGDFPAAEALTSELPDLLDEADPHLSRHDPSRATGVRTRTR